MPRLEILEDRTVPSTLTVTNTNDSGAGSLRAEIAAANSGDTLNFAPSLAGQTITLTSGELAINKSLDIEGLGANQLTVSGNNASRVFDITASNASVTIAGLTISNGAAWGGGGILNFGELTLNNCTLSGNSANGGGGAIDNESGGTLTLNNSTLHGNEVAGEVTAGINGLGGAIYNDGDLSINSSTLYGNLAWGGSGTGGVTATYGGSITASGLGGGLYVAGGSVSIDHSTLANNTASEGDGWGGGIYNAAGPGALQMHDTILANNSADGLGPDLYGSITSLGHNLIGNLSNGFGFASSDLLNVNPQLGPLQNNSGPTQTMALLAGSPAIDAGDNTDAPAYDQRGPGFARIVNGTIDIGAFEVQSGSSTSTQASSLIVTGFSSAVTAGTAGRFTVTALNADGTTDTNYTGTVHFTSSDGQASLPANYTFTAADAGVHTFSATLKTAGTQSLTATDTINTGLTNTEAGITVNPAAASKFVLSAPATVTAGVPFSLTVAVEDAYGNIVTGYSGTLHFSSTDSRAKLPKDYTFTASDQGVHTFTGLVLRRKGSQKITVTDTHNSALTASITENVT